MNQREFFKVVAKRLSDAYGGSYIFDDLSQEYRVWHTGVITTIKLGSGHVEVTHQASNDSEKAWDATMKASERFADAVCKTALSRFGCSFTQRTITEPAPARS